MLFKLSVLTWHLCHGDEGFGTITPYLFASTKCKKEHRLCEPTTLVVLAAENILEVFDSMSESQSQISCILV